MLSWPNHCTFWASSCWTANDWNSYYFVKLVRSKNNNKNPSASNIRFLYFEFSQKWKIWLSENLSFSLSWMHLMIFSPDWQKKGGQKDIYELKKLLIYNKNYYLIVPIDRPPQRLYSQRCSYGCRNTHLPEFVTSLVSRTSRGDICNF